MPLPDGVLPSPAIRDSHSTGYLIFGELDPALTQPQVQAWLQLMTGYLQTLKAPGSDEFDAAFGFGPTFFHSGGSPRFGLTTAPPACLSAPPTLPASFPFPPDFLIYAMSPEEETLVQLVRWITACMPTPVTQLRVERGFQRANKRENFGFLDGLRNPGIGVRARADVALIGLDEMGDEPAWVQGGAYLTYMKIGQAITQPAALDDDAMEEAIGRRKVDGSRLDQQPGMAPMSEPDFTDPTKPSVASHVRKVGPRGDEQGTTIGMFRRGLPYMNTTNNGAIEFGLQFVSFGDPDEFNTILTRWMSNPTFPVAGAGPDSLLAQQLVGFELAAIFIVPPADPRYIGAQIFDPEPTPALAASGRVVVKKRVTDASGNPSPQRSLRGAVFQVLQNGSPVGSPFTTDAAGHAISGELSTNVQYTLHEATPLQGANPAADQAFTLTKQRQVVVVVNVLGQAPSGYTG